MALPDRLRALDERVLGRSGSPTPTSRQQGLLCLVPLVVAALLALWAVLTDTPGLLAGCGGCLGLGLTQGVLWLRQRRADGP